MLPILFGMVVCDISISRTIDSLSIGTGVLTVDGDACASSDPYGSNDCTFKWGMSYSGHATANMTQDVTAGSKLSVDMKVDRLIPFKFECAACGAECTVTVPVVKQTITIPMPNCPISAIQLDQAFNVGLSASNMLMMCMKRPIPRFDHVLSMPDCLDADDIMSTVHTSGYLADTSKNNCQRHSGITRSQRCNSTPSFH